MNKASHGLETDLKRSMDLTGRLVRMSSITSDGIEILTNGSSVVVDCCCCFSSTVSIYRRNGKIGRGF
ncbi:hypothetical protein HanXRQr2_Chr07g0283871 [Helianthus annuus]|uniref:Uncharacterized protein n=1 Tax=Helianthus annuus TaxID=4232 RepID=A0A9K3IJP3_HELAN|nr:hypothetical protein HanXRQr2_Chr07g0283871 [Helianthus annuus]KAJ0903844.1 hypothetical protein HanPSC8_Chr07g0274721 [Helianthus annuus]